MKIETFQSSGGIRIKVWQAGTTASRFVVVVGGGRRGGIAIHSGGTTTGGGTIYIVEASIAMGPYMYLPLAHPIPAVPTPSPPYIVFRSMDRGALAQPPGKSRAPALFPFPSTIQVL